MKRCPFCAEEIQDQAIRCRYCGSMLADSSQSDQASSTSASPPAPDGASTATHDEALQYSYSGQRFLLGFGTDFFGIWDRQQPGPPVQTFPRSNEGWQLAWTHYAGMEPHNAYVGVGGSSFGGTAPAQTQWGQRDTAVGTSGFAVASLVLGLLWIWGIGSVLALVFGYNAKSDIDRSGGRLVGRGLAIAGIVLGWIGVGLMIIGLIVYASHPNLR